MQYKILLIRNRYDKKIDIARYTTEWFKKYTPLELIIEELVTNFDVTTEKVSNGTYQGVIVGGDIVDKLKTVVPEGKYNAVVFVYGNNLAGIRASCCNGSGGQFPLYKDTELIQVCEVDDGGKTINHELFHAFFYKARKCQIPLNDNMDTYYFDKILEVDSIINTNREIALIALTPYWDKICAFRNSDNVVTLTRTSDNGVQTTGNLSTLGFSCKTLERPWIGNRINVSCIPKGTYHCVYTFSWKFMKWTYEIQSVLNRSSIRIHSGNYFFDVEGCVLLGDSYKDINNDKKVDILNSKATIKKFENFMQRKPFTLVIK